MSGSMRHTMSATVPSSAVTVTSTDLDRMRRMAFSGSGTQVVTAEMEAETTMRATRRELSKARADQWPNTLEGLRKRKEAARAARLEEEERKAQELDAAAEGERQQKRLELILNATETMVEKSDKMKLLRNYRNHSRNLEILKTQLEVKAKKEAFLRAESEAEHKRMLDSLAKAAAEEERKAEDARRRMHELAASRKEQLHATIARSIEEIERVEEQGRKMKEHAAAVAAKAEADAIKRKEDAKQRNHELTMENTKLLAFRETARAKDEEAGKYYAAQAAQKEAFEEKKKALIKQRREEAAVKAAFIADTVAREFASKASTEESRLARDVAQAEASKAAAMEEKQRRQAEMRAQILAHIEESRHRALEGILHQREDEARQQKIFEAQLAAMEAEEAAAAERKRAEAKRVQMLQKAQAADKKRNIELTRRVDREALAAADTMAAGGPIDTKFHEEAHRLLEMEMSLGHNTGPLKRSIHRTLHPTIGGR